MAHIALPPAHLADLADLAIADVLRAEREAATAIQRSQVQAVQLAEASRAAARALTERTERRLRLLTARFEQERQRLSAEIDAQAVAMARPHVLDDAERAALAAAVRRLAARMTGGGT